MACSAYLSSAGLCRAAWRSKTADFDRRLCNSMGDQLTRRAFGGERLGELLAFERVETMCRGEETECLGSVVSHDDSGGLTRDLHNINVRHFCPFDLPMRAAGAAEICGGETAGEGAALRRNTALSFDADSRAKGVCVTTWCAATPLRRAQIMYSL
jgi:hypothetical protein